MRNVVNALVFHSYFYVSICFRQVVVPIDAAVSCSILLTIRCR
jgi:hypothetical protein